MPARRIEEEEEEERQRCQQDEDSYGASDNGDNAPPSLLTTPRGRRDEEGRSRRYTRESLERRLSTSSSRINRSPYSRVRSFDTAFSALRSLLPTDRKLSKIETLKLAGNYIDHLLGLLLVGGDRHRSGPRIHRRRDDVDDDEMRDDCDACIFCTEQNCNVNDADSHVLPDFNGVVDEPTTRHPAAF